MNFEEYIKETAAHLKDMDEVESILMSIFSDKKPHSTTELEKTVKGRLKNTPYDYHSFNATLKELVYNDIVTKTGNNSYKSAY